MLNTTEGPGQAILSDIVITQATEIWLLNIIIVVSWSWLLIIMFVLLVYM